MNEHESIAITATRRNIRILVGISGGIAAYKSADLVRRLIERGAEVRVVMTRAACDFITPLTLQAVSGHPVYRDSSDAENADAATGDGMRHIELARWAEMIVVAPASANFIAKVVQGAADDLLSTLILASEAPLVIAPAMNRQMWQSQATQANINTLAQRQIRIIGPGSGDQACGETGVGRMSEPLEIARLIMGDGLPPLLHGKRVLITAGPTWEAIDPVRGISNHSSGKMGFAMAQAARDFGAAVDVVAGPIHLDTPAEVNRYDVISARDMHDRVLQLVTDVDVFIGVAAVADYRPKQQSAQKIKKSEQNLNMEMVKNPDIVAEVAKHNPRPFTVGFAAETRDLLDNARSKLEHKKLDAIVANHVAAGEGGVFGGESNAATLLYPGGEITLQRTDKYALAVKILQHVHELMNAK